MKFNTAEDSHEDSCKTLQWKRTFGLLKEVLIFLKFLKSILKFRIDFYNLHRET